MLSMALVKLTIARLCLALLQTYSCRAVNLTISMGRRLRQNDTNTSEIYIVHPTYISDIQYLCPTSDIYIGRPIYSTRLRLGQGLRQGYWTSDIDIGCRIYIYWTSDIYIGRQIYILDVRYRFRKHWWHFVLNGASYITSTN